MNFLPRIPHDMQPFIIFKISSSSSLIFFPLLCFSAIDSQRQLLKIYPPIPHNLNSKLFYMEVQPLILLCNCVMKKYIVCLSETSSLEISIFRKIFTCQNLIYRVCLWVQHFMLSITKKKKGKKRGRGFMMKWAAASLPLKENVKMSRSPKPLCLRY